MRTPSSPIHFCLVPMPWTRLRRGQLLFSNQSLPAQSFDQALKTSTRRDPLQVPNEARVEFQNVFVSSPTCIVCFLASLFFSLCVVTWCDAWRTRDLPQLHTYPQVSSGRKSHLRQAIANTARALLQGIIQHLFPIITSIV